MLTKDVIAFAFKDSEIEIDYIPLADVDFVSEMKNSVDTNLISEDQDDHETLPALQIATTRLGHNSGRAYYVQTNTFEEMAHLQNLLKRLVVLAKQREEASNLFRFWQLRTRKAYESNLMQAFIALVIAAVTARGRYLNDLKAATARIHATIVSSCGPRRRRPPFIIIPNRGAGAPDTNLPPSSARALACELGLRDPRPAPAGRPPHASPSAADRARRETQRAHDLPQGHHAIA